MIDPRLKVLQAIAHYGTVTAAAEALQYTPSAVSHQIRQLGKELGTPLIQSVGRGIRLTAQAEILVQRTAVLQAEVERTYALMSESSPETSGNFTLCGFSTAATHLLPPVAAQLRDQFPLLNLHILEAEPSRCYEYLASGQADFVLVTATEQTPPSSDPQFCQRPVMDDPLDLVVPENHELAQQDTVSLADASEAQWILGQPGGAYHQLVRAACTAAGFAPNVNHYVNEWETGTALVSYGFGVIMVPRLARLNDGWSIIRVPLRGDPVPSRGILSVTRAGAEDHPINQAAQRALAKVVEDFRVRFHGTEPNAGFTAPRPLKRAEGPELPEPAPITETLAEIQRD